MLAFALSLLGTRHAYPEGIAAAHGVNAKRTE